MDEMADDSGQTCPSYDGNNTSSHNCTVIDSTEDGNATNIKHDSNQDQFDTSAISAECHNNYKINECKGEGIAPGHDSGVEVAANEYASSGALDPLSRASSLISCGSGCDDCFDIPCRSDDYKNGIATGDGTSEGGSESSSVTGGNSSRSTGGQPRKSTANGKKRVAVTDPTKSPRLKPTPAPRPIQSRAPNLATRERARSRDKANSEKPPPPGPKPTVIPKSRLRNAPDSLTLNCREPPMFKVKATKTSSARCRTPGTPPEEPRLSRSMTTSSGSNTPKGPPLESPLSSRSRISQDSKVAFDKYATLPRRRRENSPELAILRREIRSTSVQRDTSMNRSMTTMRRSIGRDSRDSPPLRSLPPYPKPKIQNRIIIYHETSMQTVLLGSDVENALQGIGISQVRTDLVPVEKCDKGLQIDNRVAEIERLEQRVRLLLEANANLQMHSDMQIDKLEIAETRLEEERAEKQAAQQELQHNTERVLAMLGGGNLSRERDGAHTLMLLESQLQTSASIVTKQQEEINKLHAACREMQKELELSHRAQKSLENHLRDTDEESAELQDFLQAEKTALCDALHDAESAYAHAETERARARADCRATLRLAEQRRQEALALKAKIAHLMRSPAIQKLESRAPALPGLANGLKTLLDSLVSEYSIIPQEIEDVIFHNEAFSRSASSEGCSPGSPPPAQPAISPRNQQPVIRTTCQLSEDENSADLLDSETEPCLMMENALEDVQVADTCSQNILSSAQSVMSCPANPINASFNNDNNKLLSIFNKEDSCSSLQNLTMFSGDELSPVIPDERYNTEMSYQDKMEYPHLDYSENDSLHNLSQAILLRQRSEAECSVSEEYNGQRDPEEHVKSSHHMIDQMILIDNLVNKLLKVLKIVNCKGNMRIEVPTHHTTQAKYDNSVNGINTEMTKLTLSTGPMKAINNLPPNAEYSKVTNESTNETCQGNGDEWKARISEGQTCTTHCSVEENNSPRHSLADCNANSPQAINSAA